MKISTPFRVKIPFDGISRLGYNNDGGYQITQWYPKPAVYDMYGWHPMPYLDMGEFYSEFGEFKVQITLPSNMVVGATGELKSIEEIDWLNKLATDSMNINDRSGDEVKTITYYQDKIHDFAL